MVRAVAALLLLAGCADDGAGSGPPQVRVGAAEVEVDAQLVSTDSGSVEDGLDTPPPVLPYAERVTIWSPWKIAGHWCIDSACEPVEVHRQTPGQWRVVGLPAEAGRCIILDLLATSGDRTARWQVAIEPSASSSDC